MTPGLRGLSLSLYPKPFWFTMGIKSPIGGNGMRFKINGQEFDMLAVQMENQIVTMIDQRWLPFKFEIKHCMSWQNTVKAIKDLVKRGAGSVGVAGAFAMVQAAHELPSSSIEEFNEHLMEAVELLCRLAPQL